MKHIVANTYLRALHGKDNTVQCINTARQHDG